MMAQPFAPPGIASGTQPYTFPSQLIQRQRDPSAMNPNHPLSAATAAALAAGHAPPHVPSEAHQSVQGIPTPAMSNSGGIPGAGPGGVGAPGGAVGLAMPRSVGAGMIGPVGPNDQRGIPGQPGAGGVHPMGAAAHTNPHTQAMLQAQAQAQAQAVQGHAMGPSMNHPYIQALKQQQQQITAQQYQQLAAQQPAHVGPNGHGHAPAMLNGPAGPMRIPNANANGQAINPNQFVTMQAQGHQQVNPFARSQVQLGRLPQGAQVNPAMRSFPLNPQIQQAIYAQAVQSVASRQHAAIQAAANAGQSLVFSSAQTHGQISQEFNARMAAFFASNQQRFHDMGQGAGRMNAAGINVGVSAPASSASGPGSVAAVSGAGLGVGPNAPTGSTLMNSASPHPSIAHPANTGRATPGHIGNVSHAGNQGATPGSTHHQTPPTTAGSQHPSHTQGPMASSAGSVSGNVPVTSTAGRAGSLQPVQPVGQGGQAIGTMGMHPPSHPSGLSMQEFQMREIQMRAAAQAQMAAQSQAHIPPNAQVLANQGHPVPNPQVQGLNQAFSMYSLHTPVDLIARLNSYGEMVSAYTQHRDRGIDYWFNFVDQFYSPTGDLRFGLKDAEAGSKKFEIAFPVIPRYYFTQFRSGMDRIQIMFENTTQRQHPDLYHTVEGRATIIYWYRNGCLHTAWTDVKAIFNPDNLIELLEFSTQENREFLPRDSVIRINTEETADEAESIEVKPQRQGQMQTAFKLPRSIVRQFGVPTDVMSFLETAETLLTMTPLFQYAQDHPELAPEDALHELVATFNNSQELQQLGQPHAEQQFHNQQPNQIMLQSSAGPAAAQGNLGPAQHMTPLQITTTPIMNPPFVSPAMMNLGVSAQNSPRLRGHPSATATHASSPGAVPMMHQRSQQVGHPPNLHATGMSRSTSVGPGVIALGSPRVGGPMGAPSGNTGVMLAGNKRRRASAVAIPEEGVTSAPDVGTARVKASPRGAGGKKKS